MENARQLITELKLVYYEAVFMLSKINIEVNSS